MNIEEALTHVGPGWAEIVRQLDVNLREQVGDYELLQAKEKFGALRFYISLPEGTDQQTWAIAHQLIGLAEDKSSQTCEECGSPGEIQGIGFWLRALCPTHRQDRQQRNELLDRLDE